MFSLYEILNQAYVFTKNHKVLWFFGFFLTSWGGLSFIRRIDLNEDKVLNHLHKAEHFIAKDPIHFIFVVGLFLVALVITFLIGAFARAVLIRSSVTLEQKEEFNIKQILKQSKKFSWKIFKLSVLVNAMMFFVLVFLLAPLYIAFSRGLINQTIILGLAAGAIYLPIVVILSLMNIFASCYVVIYEFHPVKAIHAAFDLMANFFDKIAALFLVLMVLYAVSFLFSFLLLGTVSGLIYFLGFNLHTLAISSFFVIIVSALALLTALMLFVNAVLNVFTNIAWTLFFIKIVKAERISKTESVMAHMGG